MLTNSYECLAIICDHYKFMANCIVQVYAPKTYHSDEETYNFYDTIETILKQTHYTIVMGNFNAKVCGQTPTSERATGCFGLGQRTYNFRRKQGGDGHGEALMETLKMK